MVCKNRNPFSLFQDAMFASILQCSKSYHCDTLDPNHQKRISFRLPVTFHNVCLSPTCAVLDHGPHSRNLDKQLRTCYWLVVSTHLQKYESNWKSFPIFGVKIKKIFELPPASRSPCFCSLLFSRQLPKGSLRRIFRTPPRHSIELPPSTCRSLEDFTAPCCDPLWARNMTYKSVVDATLHICSDIYQKTQMLKIRHPQDTT